MEFPADGFPKEEDDDMTDDDVYAKLNRFERIIHKDAWGGDEDHPARKALRDIGDAMFACREWFETYDVPYTGADVVAAAKLAYAREREIRDAEKRRRFEERHKIGEDA